MLDPLTSIQYSTLKYTGQKQRRVAQHVRSIVCNVHCAKSMGLQVQFTAKWRSIQVEETESTHSSFIVGPIPKTLIMCFLGVVSKRKVNIH